LGDDQVRFGQFQLDLGRRQLSREGEPLRIGSRALDILCELAAAGGNVVTKDQLMAQVWAGVTVEESNIHVHVSALRKVLDEGSTGQSYIVNVPGRGYRLIGLSAPAVPLSEAALPSHPPLPDRPSIAVLPFANMSCDPEQEYFADGVVEEIITALSRLQWLFVIARNSSFAFKGPAVDVRRAGRELGVRYVLEGSVRKASDRVRVTGQLIDTSTGAHLWADRFEGTLEDIFDLQDRITERVVGAIAPKMEQAEIERSRRKPTGSLDAYDYYLRGLACAYQGTKDSILDARKLFARASGLDPGFARAYGAASWCCFWRRVNGWSPGRAEEIDEAARLAKCVVQTGKDDAEALSWGGLALAHVVHDVDEGVAMIDRALALNPNLGAAWTASGWVRALSGEAEPAVEHLARAMRLSPLDPLMFLMHTGTSAALFAAARYEEAFSAALRAFREQPNFVPALRLMAACAAFCGRGEEAGKAIARARQLDPQLRVSNLLDRMGPFPPKDLVRYAEALRLAGLPE
jgi:TolB-like protein